jgi:hypothetical protein
VFASFLHDRYFEFRPKFAHPLVEVLLFAARQAQQFPDGCDVDAFRVLAQYL